ncbi:omptin family outer membrane protease [Atlantibacter hermannii]|uniref:omptin family outer membrane protease n=1 Tax=Atlantibacter hermannii TaxID=565 RepID=UPI0035E40EF2
MTKFKVALLALSVPVTFSSVAGMQDDIFTPEKVSAGINLGALSGQTKERVYAPEEGGRKVSQLNWKYNNAAILKGSMDWDLMPRISLGASGWTTLASRGGNMNDYDWESSSQKEWTDHSSHPNTQLNYANEFDVNAKGWLFNEPEWRIGVLAGYQESRYSFNAKGGSYSYDNGEYTGDFPRDLTVIGYKQRFKMPYIGLTGNYRFNNFEASGAFKYSAWVNSSDNDEHYLTSTTFKGKVHNQNYYSLAGSLGYYVNDNTKIYIEGVWSRVTNKKGDLAEYNYGENTNDSVAGGSGIENYSFMTTAGLKYTF